MTINDIDFEQVVNNFYKLLDLIRQGYTSEIALCHKLLNREWSDLDHSCQTIRRWLKVLKDDSYITSHTNKDLSDMYKPITIFKLTRKGKWKMDTTLKIIKQNDS